MFEHENNTSAVNKSNKFKAVDGAAGGD